MSELRAVARAGAARIVVMAVSMLCGILVIRLLLGVYDVEVYASYAVLSSIVTIVNFPDLGTGAEVVNAVARSSRPACDPVVRSVMLSVQRILLGSAATIGVLSVAIGVFGGWEYLLGATDINSDLALGATAGMLLFAVSASLGIGSRVLLGMERQHYVLLIQGLQGPVALLVVLIFTQSATGVPGGYVVTAPFIGMLCVSAGMLLCAWRFLPGAFSFVAKSWPWFRSAPGARVMHVGLPMMVQTALAPLALGTHRVILAQVVSPLEVSEYSVAAQVYLSLMGVFSAAGLALWPGFAKRMQRGESVRPARISVWFATSALVLGSVVGILHAPIFDLVTGGEVVPPLGLCIAFTAYLVVQAFLYPLGMSLMDASGLRFQIVPVILMVSASIGGSLLLARTSLGATGPLVATAAAVLVFQIAPFAARVRRIYGPL